MHSPLSNLATRRKIIFTDGDVTIRKVALDSVLITMSREGVSKRQIERVATFLKNYLDEQALNVIFVDLSQANFRALSNFIFALKLPAHGFKMLAFLISNRIIKLSISLLTFRKHYIKIFTNFNLAERWFQAIK